MPMIHQDIQLFKQALESNLSIVFDDKNNWSIETFSQKMRRFFNREKPNLRQHLCSMSKAFCYAMDELEKTPIYSDVESKNTRDSYNQLAIYFETAKLILKHLEKSYHPDVKKSSTEIQRRLIGLRYRLEKQNGGLNRVLEIDERLLPMLEASATSWKSKQTLYPMEDKSLTRRDLEKLQSTATYPQFVRLLLLNKSLQHTYFNWTIRDNCDVSVFIQFPGISERLHNSLLSKRIGKFIPDELSVREEKTLKGLKKVITLPFFDGVATQRINILDDTMKVTLNGKRELTIKDIFQLFEQKKSWPGTLELFASRGIMNWSAHEFGSFDPKIPDIIRISLNAENWWTQLPIAEEVSKETVEKRYNVEMKSGEWVRSIGSTRESLDYDPRKRHGYLEIAIPLSNGNYGIYPFGKLLKYFPSSDIAQARLLIQNNEGRIEYPDENYTFSHRQRALSSRIRTPEQGKRLMEIIRKDIIKSIYGALDFQLSHHNCAHWAQTTVTEAEGESAPNPFRMPLLKMQPSHPVINGIIKSPHSVQTGALWTFRFFSRVEAVLAKVMENRPYKPVPFLGKIEDLQQFQPGYLNKQIEEGKMKGKISYGN